MRILFCGQSGHPNNKSAAINRYRSIAKAMELDNEIIFINRFAIYEEKDYIKDFQFKVIDACNVKYRPKNIIRRNLLKIFSTLFEFFLFFKLNNERKIDWVNIYTRYFGICLFYFFLSKIFGFKTILHYVEFRSTIKQKTIFKLNNYLYDKYVMFLFDKYIPISHFLDEHLKNKNCNVKTLIIPPIADFDYFRTIRPANKYNEEYFLYCGQASYSEVIIFIIKAFEKLKSNEGIKLYLVIKGDIPEPIYKLIKSKKIKVFSNLEYEDLISLYKGSLALLIPLRNTIQDKARFPQKISEYIASGKTIITTNYGEVKYYFRDLDNALVAEKFNINDYADKMKLILESKVNLPCIEKNTYEIGKQFFDIKMNQDILIKFLNK